MSDRTLLIVPCYNEQDRLNLQEFERWASEKLQFLFYDDGSKDDTGRMIKGLAEASPFVYSLSGTQNVGKAEAVRQGMLAAKSLPVFEKVDWVGFWDADLATPLFEVQNMLEYGGFWGKPVDAIIGSRVFRLGANIERLPYRHYLARIFATIVGVMLKVKSYDSQCGAKLFRKDLIEIAFENKFVSRWIFDVEVLLRLDQSRIVEYPLTKWVDVAGSKLKPSDLITVFSDIFRIWARRSW